jgi:peptide/nickel transport system ATP-binding protein
MYAGRIAEIGPVRDVIKDAQHPYSSGLMGAIPRLGANLDRLTQIPGSMPRLSAIPRGCAFNPRCPHVMDKCHIDQPQAVQTAPGRRVACWLYPPQDSTGTNAERQSAQ